MLPECRSAMDLIDDGPPTPGPGSVVGGGWAAQQQQQQQRQADLDRAREVLTRSNMIEMSNATHLLESDVRSSLGEFDDALECLSRYEHLARSSSSSSARGRRGDGTTAGMMMQFEKARLYACSGRFADALSEYEDMLERMEKETEDLAERQSRRAAAQREGRVPDAVADDDADDDEDEAVPVMHGAAALTGVGITKLLLHLREVGGRDDADAAATAAAAVDVDEILESLDTATEVLLESRKDALLSPEHYQLAVDLGLAASIALTNSGVARCLLLDDDDGDSRAMELWAGGIATLDSILADAASSLRVIPRHKFVCMESVRARLYCNMSWILLGFHHSHPGGGGGGGGGRIVDRPSDETLRGASDAAKRALDIYDELMNGPKFMRDGGGEGGGGESRTSGDETAGEDGTTDQEWEEILREDSAAEEGAGDDDGSRPPTTRKPPEAPLSPLWIAHHRCESARALGLVARCYALAGSAVTAEGLFQSALDASSSHPFGRRVGRSSGDAGGGERRHLATVERGVSLSSPNLGLIARDVRFWYAMLCDDWDKRGGDAARIRSEASRIEDDGVLRGYVRDEDGVKRSVSGLESSLWLFSPSNFE